LINQQARSPKRPSNTSRKILGGLCLCILGGILAAGLYPFTPHPRNQVDWLAKSNGIHFGHHGFVLSSPTFARRSFSLELWLQPARTVASDSILSFYTPPYDVLWTLRQEVDDLVFRRAQQPQPLPAKVIDIAHVFRQDRKILITVESNPQRTAVYLNGKIVRVSSSLGVSIDDLLGQLIVGKEPKENHSWSGQFWGFAIYNRELGTAAVLRHYDAWARGGHPEISAVEDPVGIYTFDERNGRTIRNQVPSGPDLYIPTYFEVVSPLVLQTPWAEFHADRSYYEDLAINVAGFIPLGFLFCSYFAVSNVRRAALLSVILGLIVSLTIEILQAYIPTRDSGMTDVITNTLGSGIGAALYHHKEIQNLLTRSLSWVETLALPATK